MISFILGRRMTTQGVLRVDDHALDTDKMRFGGPRFIEVVIRKCFWLPVHNFGDRDGVIIRPVRKIDEDPSRLGNSHARHLLRRKARDLLQFSGGQNCGRACQYGPDPEETEKALHKRKSSNGWEPVVVTSEQDAAADEVG